MYYTSFPSAPEGAVSEIGELVNDRIVDIGNVAASLDSVVDSLLATGQVASLAFTDVRAPLVLLLYTAALCMYM